MRVGSVIRFRRREWVISGLEDNFLRIRPLTGTTDEEISVHRQIPSLMVDEPDEQIAPSVFPLPRSGDISDAYGARLLWQAARLLLREGASPLRSLGKISVRPRVYQLVPLLMALRIEPVRLFIADDVGVGKTIEALLIARELIDCGRAKRLAVLCPPYLCDQWLSEIRQKFNLEPTFIHSSTISRLERMKPYDKDIYEYYPFQVLSIDWVKSDRNRARFLQFCPELIIVDEVHGAATDLNSKKQQQRHELLKKVAEDRRRHLIMLTATPHSGKSEAFRSLLGLIKPEFAKWDLTSLDEQQRIELAKYFVQRTRKDIKQRWEGYECFPERLCVDEHYGLSGGYRRLFETVYKFCYDVVRAGEGMEEHKRRVRYWGVLTLLRCVMSSPSAAVQAFERRLSKRPEYEEEEADYRDFVFEASDESTTDEISALPIEAAKEHFRGSERRGLRQLKRIAEELLVSPYDDTKLHRCKDVVCGLLNEGFNPIVWCRYVATAEYVGEELRKSLPSDTQVYVITGRIPEEARREEIERIDPRKMRVLVATDCLSEGINLQEKFTAVVHYDLPWNPNRLEQREGRVDRFGQSAKKVKVVRFYGRDNPVDGAVLKVLLEKAYEIRKVLGTYVPIPQEQETIMEAILHALFLQRDRRLQQRYLFEESEQIKEFHRQWDLYAERERISRTRFAQRALKPEEVKREMEAVDQVLGDTNAVCDFVLNAAQRLGIQISRNPNEETIFSVNLSDAALIGLPPLVRFELQNIRSCLPRGSHIWQISFVSPTPEGAEYVGRNHRFVVALARFLLEDALTNGGSAKAPRCGVIRTDAVTLLTPLLCLRTRYIVELPKNPDSNDSHATSQLLSEEVIVVGYRMREDGSYEWLPEGESLRLLSQASPKANIPFTEKKEIIDDVLEALKDWGEGDEDRWGKTSPLLCGLRSRIEERAQELSQSHKRIRRAVSLKVRNIKVIPLFPPDVIAVLVLQPEVRP